MAEQLDRVMLGQTLQVKLDFLLSNVPRRMAYTLEEIWREKSGDGKEPMWEDVREVLLDRELGSGRLGGAMSRLQEARQGPGASPTLDPSIVSNLGTGIQAGA